MSEFIEDTNGDGMADTVTADLDGDGFYETAAYDTDGNGYIDVVVTVDADTGASIMEIDSDGDGETDIVLIDQDGDAYADEGFALPETTEADPFSAEDMVDIDLTAEDLPSEGDDGIHGDPREDIVYHTVQPGPVDCLPTSVSMVVSEITGEFVAAEDVVALANEHGFMNEYGMSIEGSLTLLSEYGVEAEIAYGDADALRDALDQGDEVIIALDAADLYSGDGGPFDSGLLSGHAVVLTGIDDGPPAYVYINDPAFEDGSGVQVPLELFLDAWDDAENAMIVAPMVQADSTDAAEESVSAAAAEPAVEAESESASETVDDSGSPSAVHNLILLPLTLLSDALSSASELQG